jgi:uncharacterized protein (TIGR02444 family)
MTIPADLCLDGPLWQFAGRFWSRPAAQTAALLLQERGWSVTDILCALWLALQGRRFYGTSAEQVIVWRGQVTETLRKARRAISKGNPATDQVRDCIARSELEAERVELSLAYRALTRDQPASVVPQVAQQESTVETLALENLQLAAPEKTMDDETGKLLETLTREIQIFAEGELRSC